MCPRVYVLLVALLAAMAAGVHAADRPKLPRGKEISELIVMHVSMFFLQA